MDIYFYIYWPYIYICVGGEREREISFNGKHSGGNDARGFLHSLKNNIPDPSLWSL